MKWIKVLIIMCTVTISVVLMDSCCEGYFYKWTYILTDNLKRQEVTYLDSIPKEEFGIRVHLYDKKNNYASNCQGLLINQAYAAYDCWEIYTKEDTIITLKVKSVYQFTPDNSAFSDVTDLFLAYYKSLPFNHRRSVSEVIPMINREDMSPVNHLDLVLNNDQVIDTTHLFVIEILLSDDRILTDTTKPVRIY